MKELKIRCHCGITLITLVITILILIILAGITISLTIGENGLITKAIEASRVQKISEIKEKIGLELLEADTEAQIRGEKLEQAQKEDIASKYGELQEDKDTLILKDIDAQISLKEIWNGEVIATGSYTEKIERIEELEEKVEKLKKELEDLNKTGEEKAQELTELKTELAKTTASADKILSGYTAYKLNEGIITGTMANNGELNWNPSSDTSYNVSEGYYSGGTLSTSNAYKTGFSAGENSPSGSGGVIWVQSGSDAVTGSYTFEQSGTYQWYYYGYTGKYYWHSITLNIAGNNVLSIPEYSSYNGQIHRAGTVTVSSGQTASLKMKSYCGNAICTIVKIK